MRSPKFEHNQDVVSAYSNFLELQDQKATTIENKLFGIMPFLSYIGEKDVHSIDKNDVESFMLSLKKSGRAQSSIFAYTHNTKMFLKWLFPDNRFFENVKVKRQKAKHIGEEILDIEDIKKMLAVCKSQRDRALIFLMWDTAGRLGEILNLKIKDLKPDKHGIIVTLDGKTGPREVWIRDAVPDVKVWMNLRKGEREEPLFPTPEGNPLSPSGVQSIIEDTAKRAGITGKKAHPHALRHGKLTALSNAGMSEMQLRLFAGWSNDSDMPSVYINPKKKDVKDKLLKISGIKPEDEPEQAVTAAPKKCPACNTDNPFDAVYCNLCSAVLDPKVAAEISAEATKREKELQDLKSTLMEMKVVMEKMAGEVAERRALEDEFKEVLEEERAQVRAVEEVTGMDFEDAAGYYEVGQIMPPDSENLKEHHRRLKTDQAYLERWKQVVSNRAKKKHEKTIREDTTMIINSAQKLTGMKMLNDLL